jgi:hypothetical protein
MGEQKFDRKTPRSQGTVGERLFAHVLIWLKSFRQIFSIVVFGPSKYQQQAGV